MSQSLNRVKKRINAVESTKKITGAMKLVSSVKFSRLSKEIDIRRDYKKHLNELASLFFSSAKANFIDLPYLKENIFAKKRAIVVVTSTMGMCGAYNMNVKKELENEYKNGDEIIVIGKKLIPELKSQNLKINDTFAGILNDFDIYSIKQLVVYLLKNFLNNEYKEVILIYTKYINSISFVPKKKSILPVEFEYNRKEGLNLADFEPSLNKFGKEFIVQYLVTDLYMRFYESYLSEIASRRNAMDNADKNAEDLIDKLTIEYNKARQANITQELTEVVNGSLNK